MIWRSFASAAALLAASVTAPVLAAAQSAPAAGTASVTAEDFSAIITANDIYNRIYFLASDALEGRDTPSVGLEAAAAYLVSEHRRMGLEPAGDDGTFYQRYPFQLRGSDLDRVELTLGGEQFHAGEDFFLIGGAEQAIGADVAFVAGEELPGGEPDLGGAVAVFPLEGPWSQEAFRQAGRQATLAEQAGAVAAVHVLDSSFPPEAVDQAARAMAEPRWMLGEVLPFPQIFLTRSAAERAFGEGTPYAEADGDAAAPPVRRSGVTMDARLPMSMVQQAYPPNVVAQIPGSDPELRNEYIVLSAHFDHVGVGQPMNGDSIYNGADDNASGTTALLEVARALQSLPEAPRRTVVFAHVSGEEKGLLGSRWFVDNPTIPIENAVANINADMVGSDTHADTVVIIGKEYSTLGELVEEVNAGLPELRLVASPDLWPEERLFFRSDQLNFMRREIPSLFFFTGLHECYHRPCDQPDFIDADKASRIARLIAHTVLEIANRDESPEWYPDGLEEVRRMTGAGR